MVAEMAEKRNADRQFRESPLLQRAIATDTEKLARSRHRLVCVCAKIEPSLGRNRSRDPSLRSATRHETFVHVLIKPGPGGI